MTSRRSKPLTITKEEALKVFPLFWANALREVQKARLEGGKWRVAAKALRMASEQAALLADIDGEKKR